MNPVAAVDARALEQKKSPRDHGLKLYCNPTKDFPGRLGRLGGLRECLRWRGRRRRGAGSGGEARGCDGAVAGWWCHARCFIVAVSADGAAVRRQRA